MKYLKVLVITLFSISVLKAQSTQKSPYDFDTKKIEELRMRDGLSNFFHKLNTQKEVSVAYLGGSITKAEGWRVKSFEWLEKQYPKVKFKQIDAAVSGTNADFGACRLEDNVLKFKPDLLFIEYRVNAGGNKPYQAIEGIVRRAIAADPTIDICFVYTLGKWMVKGLAEGNQTGYGSKMEKIANHYGIPTIDYAPEVMDRYKKGKLSINVPQKEEGKLWFTKDACHPTDEGHDLYRDIIARSFIKMSKQDIASRPHQANVSPLYGNNYSSARFLPLSTKSLPKKWAIVDVSDDPLYNHKNYRTKMMLGKSIIKTNKKGASFTVTYNGPFLSFSTIPNGEITIEVAVDGQAAESIFIDGTKKYRGRTSSKIYPIKDQSNERHTAVFTVKKVSSGAYFYLGQFLELKPE